MSKQPLAVIQPVRKAVSRRGRRTEPRKLPDRATADAQQVINEFQYDTVELDSQREPPVVRYSVWILAAFFVSAVAWMTWADIDRIVSARGKMVSIAPDVLVQPLESAIVRSLNVQAGDVVKAGTVLATLDPTFAKADAAQLEARRESLDAQVKRLEAERRGMAYAPDGATRNSYAALQEAVYMERMSQFRAQIQQYEQRMARARAAIAQRQDERTHLKQRLAILREVEGMRVELEEAKTGSRLNTLVARDTRIEVERNLAIAESTIIQTTHELDAIEAEQNVFRRQWDAKVIEDLVSRRNELDAVNEQLVKANKRQEMVSLETPTDAVVLEIAKRSVGSIIRDAEPFFKLVPLDSPLEVEAMVDASDVGYIAVGDPVEIKLDSYRFQEHGMLSGVLKVISSDAFIDQNRTDPEAPKGAYFRVRVEVTDKELHNVPSNFHLTPGMPVTAEIKVGARSIMSYLLRPILRGMNESMREP